MKCFTRTNLIGALGLVALAGGCATSPSEGGADETTSTVRARVTHEAGRGEAQPGQMGSSGTIGHHSSEHHGVVALFGDALSKVGLNQEQRAAVEQLGKKVTPKERLVMEARDELKEELSEQLGKGEIDEKEIEEEIEELVSACTKASPVLRGALEELHGLLDQQQREELVEALTTTMQERTTRAEGWFDRFARDLQLTDEQKTQVREVLDQAKPTLEQDRKIAARIFEAFKGETFSIDEIAPAEQVAERARAKARGMVAVAKSLTEILTPAQLQKLARKLDPEARQLPELPELPEQPGRASEGEAGEADEPLGQERRGPVGQEQQELVFGGGYGRGFGVGGIGGYRAGYHAGRIGSWGGGFGSGHMTMTGGGYVAGYPFIGGYGAGVW